MRTQDLYSSLLSVPGPHCGQRQLASSLCSPLLFSDVGDVPEEKWSLAEALCHNQEWRLQPCHNAPAAESSSRGGSPFRGVSLGHAQWFGLPRHSAVAWQLQPHAPIQAPPWQVLYKWNSATLGSRAVWRCEWMFHPRRRKLRELSRITAPRQAVLVPLPSVQ